MKKLINILLIIFIIPEGFIIMLLIAWLLPTVGLEMWVTFVFFFSIFVMLGALIGALFQVSLYPAEEAKKRILKVIAINGILQFLIWSVIIGSDR